MLPVGNSSGAKSDMDMAYERARVHFGSEDAASSPVVGKVGLLLRRAQRASGVVLPEVTVP